MLKSSYGLYALHFCLVMEDCFIDHLFVPVNDFSVTNNKQFLLHLGVLCLYDCVWVWWGMGVWSVGGWVLGSRAAQNWLF